MNNFKSIIIPIIIGLAVAITVMAFKAPTANPPNSAGQVIYADSSGNVGINVTSPTVKFEVSCPTGFTNIKAGNNQLGCMQTAEQGINTFWNASSDCFTVYGGKIPSKGEWYITMNNYNLTDETDDGELIDNERLISNIFIIIGGLTVVGEIATRLVLIVAIATIKYQICSVKS